MKDVHDNDKFMRERERESIQKMDVFSSENESLRD